MVFKGPLVHINVMEKKGVNLPLEVGFSLEARRFVEKKKKERAEKWGECNHYM